MSGKAFQAKEAISSKVLRQQYAGLLEKEQGSQSMAGDGVKQVARDPFRSDQKVSEKVSRREGRGNEKEAVLEKTMAETFPKLTKVIDSSSSPNLKQDI